MLSKVIQLFILFFFVGFFHQSTSAANLKLCVVGGVRTSKRINSLCSQLVIGGNQIDCVVGNDRFNCLRLLTMGKADFTVLEPEDLVAASAYNEYNILVTNELRLFPDDKQRYEMVIIVSKDVRNIWDVKGKRFCHPGMDTSDDDWTNAFSTYFEEWVILRECNPEKTLLENRINGLSNFFEVACIAGPWSADVTYDSKLKSKYKNLCSACDNPVGCYSSDKYHGREGALLCLTDNAGDIAWVRLNDTLEHFKVERINKEDYKYLCPDGTTRPVKFDKPCVWITKPWPVVIAGSEVAGKVEKLMSSVQTDTLGWKLRQLLENYHPTPVSTDTLETPEEFLGRFPRFMSANNRATCHPSRRVRWCITSNQEENKCRWLREASIVYGIEPAISCIQEVGRTGCLKALKTDERAEIFIALPDELLEARKMGLEIMAHITPKQNNKYIRIAAVVKTDSRHKSLKDLKGAKACFTGFRDVGWNAFVYALKNISGVESHCSDVEIVSNFFTMVSVAGLNDSDGNMPSNFHFLSLANGAGKDSTVFDCMMSGLGDVAILDLKNIEEKIGNSAQKWGNQARNKKYRTLCPSEVDAEETCLLTWAPLGAVITHANMTDLRREEIYSMLLEMDKLFGSSFKSVTPAFSMYGIYDSNSSVIFPEEAQHIQLEIHQIDRAKNYSDILDYLVERRKRFPCSGVKGLSFCIGNIILMCILIVISNKLYA